MEDLEPLYTSYLPKAKIGYYRGFVADKNFNAVSFLFGDRFHEIRSWTYQKIFEDLTSSGVIPSESLEVAENQVAQQLLNKISKIRTIEDYFLSTSEFVRGTNNRISRAEKNSLGIPFAIDNISTPVEMARFQLYRVSFFEKKYNAQPYIIDLLPDHSQGLFYSKVEYYALSHISAKNIKGIYVGRRGRVSELKKEYDPNDMYKIPVRWFYLEITRRDSLGRALEIDAFKADEGPPGLTKKQFVRKLYSQREAEVFVNMLSEAADI